MRVPLKERILRVALHQQFFAGQQVVDPDLTDLRPRGREAAFQNRTPFKYLIHPGLHRQIMRFQTPFLRLHPQPYDVLMAQHHKGLRPRTHYVTRAFQMACRVQPRRGQTQYVTPPGHFSDTHIKGHVVRIRQDPAPVQGLARVIHQRRLPLCARKAFP